jgi:hypothetical protein
VGQWLRLVADWLDAHGTGPPPADEEFIEPKLSFSVRGLAGAATATIEIGLEQDSGRRTDAGRAGGHRCV